MSTERYYQSPRSESARKRRSDLFAMICLLISSLVVVILVTLLSSVFIKGSNWLSWDFLTGNHVGDNPEESGIWQAMIGSAIICGICGLFALPIGVGTAVFLEEFKPRNKILLWLHGLVQLNINNLAGVPSIVYGILGLTAFVYMFNLVPSIQVNSVNDYEVGASYYYQTMTLGKQIVSLPAGKDDPTTMKINEPMQATNSGGETFELILVDRRKDASDDPAIRARTVLKGRSASRVTDRKFYNMHLPFGKSVLSAALTLALVILPIVIIASQEALRAVPDSLREAAFGMGATRWQMVRETVLPTATPGIMTGAILAMSRAIGEAAPLLAVMGGVLGTTTGMTNLMDQTPVLPVTIFRWAGDVNDGFENASAAAIIVLLLILLAFNSIAILIRSRHEKRLSH